MAAPRRKHNRVKEQVVEGKARRATSNTLSARNASTVAMNLARVGLLVVAVVAAGAAALLVRSLSHKSDRAPSLGTASVQVLVAAHELEPGTIIKAGDLRWQAWPKSSLAPTFMSQAALPKALDQAAGSTLRTHLDQGEPVTTSKLIKADGSGLLAAMLTPGMRAISTKIDESTAAGGFILPGDHVDVVMTRQREGKASKGYASETVLSDVRVLAIGQAVEGSTSDKALTGKTATLELTSEQAEKLALANAMGKLTLVLRSAARAEGLTAAVNTPADQPKSAPGPINVVRYGHALTLSMTDTDAGGAQ